MTLRLMDSPLYDQFNFTAVRQDGVWTVTPDDPDNHSTYVEFSYEDGWRATIRDSVCLPPGRYTFEVSTDCGVDTALMNGLVITGILLVLLPHLNMKCSGFATKS